MDFGHLRYQEEIGSFRNGQIEELKILGATTPVAIEVKAKPFAPVVDVQNTIRQLIDWNTKEVAFENSCDAFGKGLAGDIPYAYVGKRYDASSGLVYFGKRFYDPNLGRWLTPDPLGAVDHSNLYQYVFNNPFKYYDPHGESLGGYLLGIGEIVLGGTIVLTGGVLEIASCGGFTLGFGFTTKAGFALMGVGVVTAAYHAQDLLSSKRAEFPNFANAPTSQEYYSNGIITVPVPEGYGDFTRINKSEGCPPNNSDQNKQARDARRKIETEIGRKLTKDEKEKFHRDVSGQGYGYHELVEEGIGLFGGK